MLTVFITKQATVSLAIKFVKNLHNKFLIFYRLEYEAYRKEFSKKLHQLRSNDEFCDIDIQVGSQTFRAHKIILAAGSSYFSAMFCSGMMEDHADVVTLYDIDPKIFSVLLDFIYLGM